MSKVYGPSPVWSDTGVRHLITGAGGFLGSHLIERIQATDKGCTVDSLGLAPTKNPQVNHFECDLLDQPKVAQILAHSKPDFVYHLAGSARVSQEIGMPEYYRSNFQTTQNLIQCLEQDKRPFRLFFSSSVHVYGNQSGEVSEATLPAPHGYYGMSKYLCERALEEFSKRRPDVGIVVGRLYSCIGPGQAEGFVVSDLTRKLIALPPEKESILETRSLKAYRRFLDIRDAADLITRLMQRPLSSQYEVVNIASPFELEVKRLVEMLVKVSGKRAKIQPRETSENPFRGLQLNIEKLKRLAPTFHFRPLETTLADTWNWANQAL